MTRTEHNMLLGGIVIVLVLIVGGITLAPAWVRARNEFRFNLQTIHDQTDYATLRRVEDTARAMIATWEADRLMWGAVQKQ